MEIWKDISEYEGLYQVSNLGRVKALGNGNSNNSKERILKPVKDKDKYLFVGLCKQGKRKIYKVHRLVAEAFIENPKNLQQVNHKNEIKSDNRVENLEFCDAKYNSNYGTRNKRSAKSRINHQKLSKQVLCVETGKIYSSLSDVERQLGFEHSHISKCCKGKRKTSYGFHWKYVE